MHPRTGHQCRVIAQRLPVCRHHLERQRPDVGVISFGNGNSRTNQWLGRPRARLDCNGQRAGPRIPPAADSGHAKYFCAFQQRG